MTTETTNFTGSEVYKLTPIIKNGDKEIMEKIVSALEVVINKIKFLKAIIKELTEFLFMNPKINKDLGEC